MKLTVTYADKVTDTATVTVTVIVTVVMVQYLGWVNDCVFRDRVILRSTLESMGCPS